MSHRFGEPAGESDIRRFDPNRTIPDYFLDIMRQGGEMAARAALINGDRVISYSELDLDSNRFARYLMSKGVGLGSRVGLFLHRSPEAVVAMLGILKSGAAFVPLDPTYPADHLAFIAADSAPATMVSATHMFGGPEQAKPWTSPTILVDAEAPAIARESAAPLDSVARGDDLAYVMYTSGTTGRPKGVMVPHRGVTRLARNDFVEWGRSDVVLQLAPLAFDASTFEIWGGLLNGAALAIVGSARPSFSEIGAAIARHGVTTAWLTAALFHAIVEHHVEILRPLRQLIAGGDVLSPRHVRQALDQLPGCRLVNGYGPTENTTFTCCHSFPRDARADAAAPIGQPIAHTRVYVLDEDLRPVAAGQVGELFAAGAGVALGYLNRPDLTAEKFLPDVFGGDPGRLMYRTGDLVRQRADGVVEFVGRADRQIKINGKRVELDEVEATLRRLPEVADAAAIAPTRGDGQRHIVAYITTRRAAPRDLCPPEHGAPDAGELRQQFLLLAPDYMAPARFIFLDALPLTPNGKVDRDALPVPPAVGFEEASPAQDARQAETCAMAATDPEVILAAIWRGLLNVASVGVDANFFDLGGTSLDVMTLHEEIRARFKRDVPITALFEYTTIRALAAYLQPARAPTRDDAQAPPAPTENDAKLPMTDINNRKLRQSEALARASRRHAFSAR